VIGKRIERGTERDLGKTAGGDNEEKHVHMYINLSSLGYYFGVSRSTYYTVSQTGQTEQSTTPNPH
jgi:hypothetical protein